jgi:hypothetical protein
MEVLHGQTVPSVLKELTVFAIVYNLVRMVMRQSATLQHTTVERISFLDALRWLSAPSTSMLLVALIVNPLIQAPECVNSSATDVPPGTTLQVTGLGEGNHRFQCCIHPWMRTLIKVLPDD